MIQTNPEMFKFITWIPEVEPMKVPKKGKFDTGMKNFLVTVNNASTRT